MIKTIFLLSIPIVSAFIGWLTNYFAIKMLFKPHKPIKILFITFQGIIPKRRDEMASQLGSMIAREIIATEDVVDKLTADPGLSRELKKAAEVYMDRFLREKLLAKIPMAKMFINPSLIDAVKELFFHDWETLMLQIKAALKDHIGEEMKVDHLVREKIRSFSLEKLEEMALSMYAREFRFIEWVGAGLGAVIGCAQLILAWFYHSS